MASGAAGERLMDKFSLVPGIDHGGGGTHISKPKVYIGVNKESVPLREFMFEFADHTCQEFAAMHTGLMTANLWSVLPCCATQEYSGELLTASVD